MKKTLLVAALVSSGALVNVQAADRGIIEFTGKITDSTCSVTVNGSSATETVTLAPVSASTFSAVGDTAAATGFIINVTGCSGTTNVIPFFESGADVDVTTGRLNNSTTGASAATGVQLEIVDGSTPVKIGDASALPTTYPTITSGAMDFNYDVRYYASAATVGAGDVTAKVSYVLSYQ